MMKRDGSLVWHYVEKWAKETPDAEASVYGARRTTYAELSRDVDRLASRLIELGVKKGDRVMMMSPARDEFPTAYMATLKAGAVWVGLNPRYTRDEIRRAVADARPVVLATVREHMGRDFAPDFQAALEEFDFIKACLVFAGEPFGGRTERYEDVLAREIRDGGEALERRALETRPDDGALIVYTSGTAGTPKGAVLTHRAIVANIAAEVSRFGMEGGGARILLHFPVNHVAGATEISVASLMSGGCMILMDHFHPVESLRAIEREKIQVVGQVPTMFLMQMAQPEWKTTDLSSVKTWVWAGAAGPEAMIRALLEKGGALLTGYGMTELTGFVTYTDPGDDFETLLKTVGRCDPAFELKIVDENRKAVPAGEVGEIAVRGDLTFKEYFNRPEATAEVKDADGWFYTGDLGSLDENGRVSIAGRRSEMFKSGGFNVYPREIEAVLEDCPGVAFAAVVGVPDPLYQEVGKAFVVPKPGSKIDAEALRSLCGEKLANYKVPRTVEIRTALPFLPNGKIDKKQLKGQ